MCAEAQAFAFFGAKYREVDGRAAPRREEDAPTPLYATRRAFEMAEAAIDVAAAVRYANLRGEMEDEVARLGRDEEEPDRRVARVELLDHLVALVPRPAHSVRCEETPFTA